MIIILLMINDINEIIMMILMKMIIMKMINK